MAVRPDRSRAINDLDDPRLARVLAHPLRVRALALIEELGTASPKQLAERLEAPLENLSYHVRVLRDHGFIELERREQVRGAHEHHYRATARPRITAQAWEQLPDIARRQVAGAALEAIGAQVARAAQGGFERPESLVARRPLRLDEEGFRQASDVIGRALDELSAIAQASERRAARDEDLFEATVVGLLFESAD